MPIEAQDWIRKRKQPAIVAKVEPTEEDVKTCETLEKLQGKKRR
jgi:hypothetical protein